MEKERHRSRLTHVACLLCDFERSRTRVEIVISLRPLRSPYGASSFRRARSLALVALLNHEAVYDTRPGIVRYSSKTKFCMKSTSGSCPMPAARLVLVSKTCRLRGGAATRSLLVNATVVESHNFTTGNPAALARSFGFVFAFAYMHALEMKSDVLNSYLSVSRTLCSPASLELKDIIVGLMALRWLLQTYQLCDFRLLNGCRTYSPQ